ncbi:MAG: nucleotide pyrophosphohydrolase [Gammaproteobacteria bacterium]|nr:nucleotide pyrophosphohydrolase [Gammaproteobacteria bacterium]
MSSSDLNTLKQDLRANTIPTWAEARDWEQFHSPKNLSMALSAEVAEIVEHFQWLTEEQSKNLPKDKLEEVETELADTFIYLIRLADKLDIIKGVGDKQESFTFIIDYHLSPTPFCLPG